MKIPPTKTLQEKPCYDVSQETSFSSAASANKALLSRSSSCSSSSSSCSLVFSQSLTEASVECWPLRGMCAAMLAC
eukprot:6473741-Amphidinium_carterae.2